MTRTLIGIGLALSTALLATPAQAARIDISFGAPPPLVEIEPGIQVVPDVDHEVFYSDGAYWYYSDDGWYRSPDWRGGWVWTEPRYVPAPLYGVPRGHYVQWHPREYRGPAPVVYYGRSAPAQPYYGRNAPAQEYYGRSAPAQPRVYEQRSAPARSAAAPAVQQQQQQQQRVAPPRSAAPAPAAARAAPPPPRAAPAPRAAAPAPRAAPPHQGR